MSMIPRSFMYAFNRPPTFAPTHESLCVCYTCAAIVMIYVPIARMNVVLRGGAMYNNTHVCELGALMWEIVPRKLNAVHRGPGMQEIVAGKKEKGENDK